MTRPAAEPSRLRLTDRGRRHPQRPDARRALVAFTHYEHDFGALRAASTRIVVGAGAESEGTFSHRAALAVAERLGIEGVILPSHHGGFLGGEFGWHGQPNAFAATLRRVLGETANADRLLKPRVALLWVRRGACRSRKSSTCHSGRRARGRPPDVGDV